ncbi:MAG: DUF4838 domain-containing protein [Oscillospiraceae bacterium]|nr:DUF4838 domain-containing protein [Oscillospiraceae bacterium]
MSFYKGLLIHPEELCNDWIKWAVDAKLDVIGLHPVGGEEACSSLDNLLQLLKSKEFLGHLNQLKKSGIQVEYCLHALSWLLPRKLFEQRPEWFRVNDDGQRSADKNFCPSNSEAMAFLEQQSSTLCELLYTDNHRYHFWADDAASGRCYCHECLNYSPSDNQMRVLNVILKGIRRADPKAKLSYLAYYDTLEPPKRVAPDNGIFLEFAPMDRNYHRPLADSLNEKNKNQFQVIAKLLDCFGKADATALDYWMDNSLFSGWKKPPALFNLDVPVLCADAKMYAGFGFEYITSFACYLGPDYVETHNVMPPIKDFAECLNKIK